MVLAHGIKQWMDKRHKKQLEAAREQGLEQGLQQGRNEGREAIAKARAEERSLWQDWLARKEDAESRGEPFTESPPNGTID